MSESMMERVARAIGRVNMPSVEWADLMDVERDFFTEEARAAIAAMREPTIPVLEKAVEAGYECKGKADYPMNPGASIRVLAMWNGGIDAALSEPKGE